MKDYKSLGRVLADLRINQALSQADLGNLLGYDRSDVAAWEAGKNPPNREVILKVVELVGVNKQSTNYLLGLAGYEPLPEEKIILPNGRITETGQKIIEQPINTEAVKEIQVQVKDIQASIDALGSKIEGENLRSGDHELLALTEELQNAKIALKRLQTTSREITAPVTIPSSADLAVKLVPSTVLERLEEYRSEESKWLSILGIFIGAILGVFINVATGANMSSEAWIILVFLSLMVLITGWSAWTYRKRGNVLKAQLLDKGEPNNEKSETS